MVFLVGAPRSGTTWLQRLLASHPKIKTGQESRLFEYVGRSLQLWKIDLKSCRGQGLPCYLNEPEFLSMQKEHLDSFLALMLKNLKPGEIFLEKTPAHALYVAEIFQLLPKAKIVHLARDPRDVVASLLAASKSWGRLWAPSRAEDAARMWMRHVWAVQNAATQLPAAQFLEIHYEDLYRETVATLQKISSFLNLSWIETEMSAAVKANAADELRAGRGTPIPIQGEHGEKVSKKVREPENFVRKARPGAWREDLTLLNRLRTTRILNKTMSGWKKFAKT